MAHSKPRRLGKTRRAPRFASKAGLVSTTAARGGFGIRYRIAVDVPVFDPVAIVDQLSDVVMSETWHAIGEGRKADGSGPQPELKRFGAAGRRAREGQRPDARGFTGLTTKPFRDEIFRRAIRVTGRTLRRTRVVAGVRALAGQAFLVAAEIQGTRARTQVKPAKIHKNFLKFEADRGIAYFFVGGFMGSLVDEAIANIFKLSMERLRIAGDKRERKAAAARTK